jgi:hypothetical protein
VVVVEVGHIEVRVCNQIAVHWVGHLWVSHVAIVADGLLHRGGDMAGEMEWMVNVVHGSRGLVGGRKIKKGIGVPRGAEIGDYCCTAGSREEPDLSHGAVERYRKENE